MKAPVSSSLTHAVAGGCPRDRPACASLNAAEDSPDALDYPAHSESHSALMFHFVSSLKTTVTIVPVLGG